MIVTSHGLHPATPHAEINSSGFGCVRLSTVDQLRIERVHDHDALPAEVATVFSKHIANYAGRVGYGIMQVILLILHVMITPLVESV